ncbi:uncharacterized protein LOC119615329 [Lucilia sericata]|uniref:uncharacterized protein LOC119615329 n=1 Tax=Lucilia sericata TaxID=13632 RepID=UPI0018A84834|nr:uncharacterized protein LOC119615329 [Lucilia sericata]
MAMQQNSQQQQQQQHQTQRASAQSTSAAAGAVATTHFTNTAKLPIETVKLLIGSVSRRPNLWIRTNNGQKRSDINALWQQVSQEVHLPADICRIKWGHLRDNFRKVFIRNTISAEPPTTWRFYNDMRFMEAAVAENVMRHHRLREQSLYWQGLHGAAEPRHSNSTSLATTLNDNSERSLENQFNFSEISAFFQNHGHNKRIKLETSESDTSLHDLTHVTPPIKSFYQNSNAYEKSNNHTHHLNEVQIHNDVDENNIEDDDDDDQFDEDATSIEDNYQMSMRNEKFSIDNNSKINVQNCNLSKKETKEEEICRHHDEQDSDRMFLLSLLPYLRKVKEQRKLQVRQKLQDVLIQEFG